MSRWGRIEMICGGGYPLGWNIVQEIARVWGRSGWSCAVQECIVRSDGADPVHFSLNLYDLYPSRRNGAGKLVVREVEKGCRSLEPGKFELKKRDDGAWVLELGNDSRGQVRGVARRIVEVFILGNAESENGAP